MDVHDRMLSLAGRDVLFRPIEFERYRKPHVVEYPRHAVVLNPQHTRQQQHQSGIVSGEKHKGTGLSHSSDDDEDDDEDDVEGRRRRRLKGHDGSDDDDDDDPRYMPRTDFLCSDHALEKVMHLRWKEVRPTGVGLLNLGNTCFANSVLQSIAYTPALAQYFAETYRAADNQLGAPYDFAYALGETIRQLHSGRGGSAGRGGGACRPGLIVGHLKALSSHFFLGRQSDAHEFTVQLILGCQKSILYRQVGSKKLPLRVTCTTALSRICGGYLRSQVAWSRQDEIQQLLRAGKRQGAMDLKMELRNSHGAAGDRLVSNTYDPTNVLHIDLVGQTLEHCLAKFTEAEKLQGRCYHSPRDVAVVATKQMKLHLPPNVLILHMKRFTPTGAKVAKYIQYPVKLDLYPYTTSYEQAKQNGAKKESPCMYELNAICVHEGSSINYGHYYAVVRARNGAWYECNDASVYPLSQEKALRQQAYMLFYSRVPADRSRKAAPTAEPKKTPLAKAMSSAGAAAHQNPASPSVLEAVGEELTEDQVAALLAKRQKTANSEGNTTATSSSRTPNSPKMAPVKRNPTKKTQDSGHSEEEDEEERRGKEVLKRTARHKNKFLSQTEDMRLSMKRERQDLFTDEDDEGDADEDGAAAKVKQELKTNTKSTAEEPQRASGSGGGLRRSMYGGVVKAIRTNASTPLGRALQARGAATTTGTTSGKRGEEALPQTKALGRAAVIALKEQKQQVTPATVQRDVQAPKFQQRIHDPMWEMEMDKGRVKKVKERVAENVAVDEHGRRLNRFQEKSKNRFDSRGRRVSNDGNGEL